VQDGVLAVVVDKGAVLDSLILLFEVGGEGGAVAAALLNPVSDWKVFVWKLQATYVGLCCD